MAELLIELFCEEIPSGMQARAAHDLVRLLVQDLSELNPRNSQHFYGARRIAAVLELDDTIPARVLSHRGPRETAPEKAIAGFSRKHQVSPDQLVKENGFWVLNQEIPPISAPSRIAEVVPDLLWKFPWPKAMRWGKGSHFSWVRPLHRIVCLLDGNVVPFSLAREHDDAHGLRSSNITEGHRFLSPGPFSVYSAQQWREELSQRHVVVEDDTRQKHIRQGVQRLAADKNLTLVEDEGLVKEISGLVEYPVPLLGRIHERYMSLPPEVMQVSMRVNQRYFALQDHEGRAAPYFAFIANRTFDDGGTLSVAGNERVLSARFADARHFWDLDRKTPLIQRVSSLKLVTFHARLGTQEARAQRIAHLAGHIAATMHLDDTSITHAKRAGLLAKADLTTGMVGEFPELQGIMGGYYAAHDGEAPSISQAISEHYMPRGQHDDVPRAPISIAVALADRLDMLAGFFAIGETPSGSGDPYALRRASLAIIRIIRENNLRIDIGTLLLEATHHFDAIITEEQALYTLENFFTDRLKVQLRNEGRRHDVLDATLAVSKQERHETLFSHYLDGDFVRLLNRVDALSNMIDTEDGSNLLAAYRRATNILRIENQKDGPHRGDPDPSLYSQEEEKALGTALHHTAPQIHHHLRHDDFTAAMQCLATLRPIMDRFFEAVTVNTNDAPQRLNRLRLLAAFSHHARLIADFSKIESP